MFTIDFESISNRFQGPQSVHGGPMLDPKVLFRHLTRCFGQQLLLTLSEALRFAILGTLLVHFCRWPGSLRIYGWQVEDTLWLCQNSY